MPLRDLALFGCVGVLLPVTLLHPYVGSLLWVVFGLMNPHRLTFGPAYNFQFAMVIAVVTLIGIALTRDHRQIKGGAAGVVLIVLAVWTSVTTLTALTPGDAIVMWERVIKVFLMTFVLMLLLHTKRQTDLLIAAILLSIGFYGVKGGIFTIWTGGQGMVNGPEDSMIMGNNSLGVANAMIIPLFLHFYQQARNRWVRIGLLACIFLCAAAVLGSYSRGALLALVAMCMVLWVRSTHRSFTLIVVLTITLILIPLMPERWAERMHTIQTYEMDGSALGRIHAWQTAWNIATDRFLGGGFEYPTREVMDRYSPGPHISVAHSIYFQMLGEHGFVGLALFLLFWTLVWRQTSRVRHRTRDRPELRWAYSLMSMTQASLVAYAVGGAFLNLAFWDMPYYLYAAVVVTRYIVDRAIATESVGEPISPLLGDTKLAPLLGRR